MFFQYGLVRCVFICKKIPRSSYSFENGHFRAGASRGRPKGFMHWPRPEPCDALHRSGTPAARTKPDATVHAIRQNPMIYARPAATRPCWFAFRGHAVPTPVHHMSQPLPPLFGDPGSSYNLNRPPHLAIIKHLKHAARGSRPETRGGPRPRGRTALPPARHAARAREATPRSHTARCPTSVRTFTPIRALPLQHQPMNSVVRGNKEWELAGSSQEDGSEWEAGSARVRKRSQSQEATIFLWGSVAGYLTPSHSTQAHTRLQVLGLIPTEAIFGFGVL